MTTALLIELGWKSTLCAGLVLLALAALRRRSADEKALIAHVGVLALVVLPVAMLALPALRYPAPLPVVELLAPAAGAEAAPVSATAMASAPERLPFDGDRLLVGLYLAVSIGFLLGLLVSVVRLQRVRSRAEVIEDPVWLTALAAAQRRSGLKHGTALLSSRDIRSPVSWGLVRSAIIVDDASLAHGNRAEAIITHELAHIIRMDWWRLLLGRLALILFWFNPLVWMLVGRTRQLSEEAADDAVLRTDIRDCDYAELLLGAVCHAHRPSGLFANAVAPSRTSLRLRIDHVLDRSRARRPARYAWTAASLLIAASLNGVIAAAEPMAEQAMTPLGSSMAEATADRLDRIGDRHSRALADALRRRDWSRRAPAGHSTFNQPAAVQPLRAALRDPDPRVRRIAVWGLAEMRPAPGTDIVEAIAARLRDSDPDVRAQAARALGDLQASRHARPVAGLLRDPVPAVRLQAAHALGDLQNPDSRSPLEAAANDPDPAVRSKISWALRQVANTESVLRQYGGD